MLDDRDLLEDVAFRLRHPKMGLFTLNLLYYKLKREVGLTDGVDVVAEDWDNLVILDACRFDAFAQVVGEFDLPGRLEARRSKAPYTRQFIRQSFGGRDLHDTVYVTANPQLHKVEGMDDDGIDADFHAVVHTFLDENVEGIDTDEVGYRPRPTTELAKRANEEYPDKRLIVHYLPPHWPFVGETGERLFDGVDDAPWEDLIAGRATVSKPDLWEAYLENLRIGLEHVEELFAELDGKTVVTADHGQLLGDRTKPFPVEGYGHPGVHVDALVTVPWFVCDHETRKRVVAETPDESPREAYDSATAERKVEQTLRDLGYAPD